VLADSVPGTCRDLLPTSEIEDGKKTTGRSSVHLVINKKNSQNSQKKRLDIDDILETGFGAMFSDGYLSPISLQPKPEKKVIRLKNQLQQATNRYTTPETTSVVTSGITAAKLNGHLEGVMSETKAQNLENKNMLYSVKNHQLYQKLKPQTKSVSVKPKGMPSQAHEKSRDQHRPSIFYGKTIEEIVKNNIN
jgi:hypothetical protein